MEIQLPEEIIELILVSMPLDDMKRLGYCNRKFYLLYKKLCQHIAEEKYADYFPAFRKFIDHGRWGYIVNYFSRRRIIPIYDKIIVGYLLISPSDTLIQFYHALKYIMVLVNNSGDVPQTKTGLAIIRLDKIDDWVKNFVITLDFSPNIALLSTSTTQEGVYPTFRTFNNRDKILMSTYIDTQFVDKNKKSGITFHLSVDNHSLGEISIDNTNLFDTLELIYHRKRF